MGIVFFPNSIPSHFCCSFLLQFSLCSMPFLSSANSSCLINHISLSFGPFLFLLMFQSLESLPTFSVVLTAGFSIQSTDSPRESKMSFIYQRNEGQAQAWWKARSLACSVWVQLMVTTTLKQTSFSEDKVSLPTLSLLIEATNPSY